MCRSGEAVTKGWAGGRSIAYTWDILMGKPQFVCPRLGGGKQAKTGTDAELGLGLYSQIIEC